VLIGGQDRWTTTARESPGVTEYLDGDGQLVRVTVSRASKLFPPRWLKLHMRRNGRRFS
jgi:hypothetical protein